MFIMISYFQVSNRDMVENSRRRFMRDGWRLQKNGAKRVLYAQDCMALMPYDFCRRSIIILCGGGGSLHDTVAAGLQGSQIASAPDYSSDWDGVNHSFGQ